MRDLLRDIEEVIAETTPTPTPTVAPTPPTRTICSKREIAWSRLVQRKLQDAQLTTVASLVLTYWRDRELRAELLVHPERVQAREEQREWNKANNRINALDPVDVDSRRTATARTRAVAARAAVAQSSSVASGASSSSIASDSAVAFASCSDGS